jgi:hypothetical protein
MLGLAMTNPNLVVVVVSLSKVTTTSLMIQSLKEKVMSEIQRFNVIDGELVPNNKGLVVFYYQHVDTLEAAVEQEAKDRPWCECTYVQKYTAAKFSVGDLVTHPFDGQVAQVVSVTLDGFLWKYTLDCGCCDGIAESILALYGKPSVVK